MFINIYIYVCVCKYINFSTKILKKAGKLSTGGFLNKTASGNAIFIGGFLRKPPVEMLFPLAVL
jgi:hypothetical protein